MEGESAESARQKKLQILVQPIEALLQPQEQLINVLIIRYIPLNMLVQRSCLVANKRIVIASIAIEKLESLTNILCKRRIFKQPSVP